MNSQFSLALDHHRAGRVAEARVLYLEILKAAPNHPGALGRLAVILAEEGNAELAVKFLGHAISIDGGNPANWLNLGLILAAQDRHQAAAEALERAAALNPADHQIWRNLGFACLNAARIADSIAAYDRAVALAPDDRDIRMGRAGVRLLAGDMPGGWEDYEARRSLPEAALIDTGQPEWNLDSPSGSIVLVLGEQGMGDNIQFLRYLSLVAGRGHRVIFRVPQAIAAFLSAAQPVPVIGDGQPLPPHDFQIPLLSLPRVFRTSKESIPAPPRYLTAEPERVEFWKSRLPAAGLRIGLVWQGRPKPSIDRGRSIALREFAPLAGPGTSLISLQKLYGLEQLPNLPGIVELGADFDPGPDLYRDTAAVMECLDLIVTSDTSAAHLAGALGRPVWLALKRVPDWRWGISGEACPWYPSMRLFRQETDGDWKPVFARMAAGIYSAASLSRTISANSVSGTGRPNR